MYPSPALRRWCEELDITGRRGGLRVMLVVVKVRVVVRVVVCRVVKKVPIGSASVTSVLSFWGLG